MAVARGHDEEVAHVLIAIDGGAWASLEALVPDADAVHRHVRGVGTQAVLDVIAAHEDGDGQSLLADVGDGDAREPPCAVGVLHLDVDPLVLDDLVEAVDEEVRLHLVVDTAA